MSIKFKQTGLTEKELINLPKVNKNCIFIGEERVYIKRKKDDIVDLGSLELLRDLENVFSWGLGKNLILYTILSKNEYVSTFKGNAQVAFKKLVESTDKDNLRRNYLKYLKLTREERKQKDVWLRSRRNYPAITKGYYFNKIDDENKTYLNEDGTPKDSWSEGSIERYKERIKIYKAREKESSNYLYTLTKHSKLLKNYANHLVFKEYHQDSYSFELNTSQMYPITETPSPLGLLTRYAREEKGFYKEKELIESTFNSVTGELSYVIDIGIQKYHISLNVYKDEILFKDKGNYKNLISFEALTNAILDSYKDSNINEEVKYEIIKQVVKNKGLKLGSLWCFGNKETKDRTNYVSLSSFNRSYFIKNEEEGNINILSIIKEIVLAFDKLNNLKEYRLFNNNPEHIRIPNKKKWKVHESLGLDKQNYKKLLEYNVFEQCNFLAFHELLKYYFPSIYNLSNVNELFGDTFLMIQDKDEVIEAMKLDSWTVNVFNIKFKDFRKMVHYLDVDVQDRQRIYGYAIKNYYTDYLKDLATLVYTEYRTLESVNLTPFSLKLEHDIASDESQAIKHKVDDARLEEAYEDKLDKITNKVYTLGEEKIKFIKADTTKKLKDEGKSLSHCVGGYANRIISGQCLILLARHENAINSSWFTVEIRITNNGYVLGQQQSINEYKLPNELKKQLEKDLKKLNKEQYDIERVA